MSGTGKSIPTRAGIHQGDDLTMNDERWLSEWIDIIRKHAGDDFVLELGSGRGRDSEALSQSGLKVVAVDLSLESLRTCSQIENCMPVQIDLAYGFPFTDNSAGMILASLSLHYFSRATTRNIMNEIKRVIRPGGMLLVRVNSIEDVNFGAGQGAQIEKDYYQVGSRSKRFFDEGSVKRLLKDFDIQMIRHRSIDRYGKPKQVWEANALGY